METRKQLLNEKRNVILMKVDLLISHRWLFNVIVIHIYHGLFIVLLNGVGNINRWVIHHHLLPNRGRDFLWVLLELLSVFTAINV